MSRFFAGLELGLVLGGLFAALVAHICWPVCIEKVPQAEIEIKTLWKESALECAEMLETMAAQARTCCGVTE